jgi:hypothetical protein
MRHVNINPALLIAANDVGSVIWGMRVKCSRDSASPPPTTKPDAEKGGKPLEPATFDGELNQSDAFSKRGH